MNISRWDLAKIAAIVKADTESQQMIDAKIEVENFCNGTDNNFVIEEVKVPSLWSQIKFYLFMRVKK